MIRMNRTTATTAATLLAGAAVGAITTWVLRRIITASNKKSERQYCLTEEYDKRTRLPSLIILVRHGESEGNADHTLWRTQPDNLIELSPVGVDQAERAGERIERIFEAYDKDTSKPSIRRVHVIASPFERTLQTSFCARSHFEHRIVRTDVESRIREQEFGNLQDGEFEAFRKAQKTVGRFWYRFPTGESGADVYDRVKTWWFESVLQVNARVGYDHVDALVVVTHGLTMRFVLMQLFHWSPSTFHSVWNADNCDLYVLKKDLQKPGMSPYVLDDTVGEIPRSSVDISVTFANGQERVLKLEDYLSIPPPRTTRLEIVKEKLVKQYPSIDPNEIVNITIARSASGHIRATPSRHSSRIKHVPRQHDPREGFQQVKPEYSCRFPDFSPAMLEDPKERAYSSGEKN